MQLYAVLKDLLWKMTKQIYEYRTVNKVHIPLYIPTSEKEVLTIFEFGQDP
jgi:hypothetical protein